MAVATGALLALLLGYLGYREALPESSHADALFRSLQLFVLEGGVPNGGTPWQLNVARFLAPAVIAYAAIAGILLLARDQVQQWRTRLFSRGHVVVVGLSAEAREVARQLLAAGRRVVVVGLDDASPSAAAAGLRELGATVVEAEPTDGAMLARVRLERATDVVIAPWSDTEAISSLAACESAIDGSRSVPALHVRLLSPDLWRQLHSVGLATAERRVPVEFFLPADRIARTLLRSACEPGGAPRTLLVHGAGTPATQVIEHAAREAVIDGRGLTVAISGPWAEAQSSELGSSLPWLEQGCDLRVTPPFGSLEHPVAGIVCGLPDAEAIAAGTALGRDLDDGRVIVEVSDVAIARALAGTQLDRVDIELVAAREAALGSDLFATSGVEIIARAKHDDYVARERQRGAATAANPSMVDWNRLPESLRISNRRFAESVASKLAAVGATLVPLDASAITSDLHLGEELLEQLAIGEHDRWVRDLRADGWDHTEEAKDPERKLHRLLVPWSELSEAEREKDRDGFRALPALLARAGYQLRLEKDAS